MDGSWIWDGSCARGDDGLYHLYTSRWPTTYPMHPGWLFCSETVHAVAEHPEGPFTFRDVALPRRDKGFFDGMATFNPTVQRCGDTWLLFYVGVTYPFEISSPEDLPSPSSRLYSMVWGMKRIGLATASSPDGPWIRRDTPILEPRSGCWDNVIASNPAPCVLADGSVRLLYKSSHRKFAPGSSFDIGLAVADHWSGQFRRGADEPVLKFDRGYVEDPFLWFDGRAFHCIAKDMSGEICGETGAGVHFSSPDCLKWRADGKAYSKTVLWDDGASQKMGSFERPSLLLENGRPVCLYAATGDGPGGFENCKSTWSVAVPFQKTAPELEVME
jgi:hypothetical protein